MAPRVMPLTFLIATFLQISLAFPESAPSLVVEPEPRYYVGKEHPVKLVCAARNAEDISFTCVGLQIPPTSMEVEEASDLADDPSSIRASITIPRADVVNYHKQQKAEMAASEIRDKEPRPFWCECNVLDIDGEIFKTSRRSIIKLAHLRHRFTQQPQDSVVDAGSTGELICGAPLGNPKPEISWTKDSLPVSLGDDHRVLITDRGSLVITDTQAEDAGVYQCKARNAAGVRLSHKVDLKVEATMEDLTEQSDQQVDIVKSRTPRQTDQRVKPKFTMQPSEDIIYVAEGKDNKIVCAAVGVAALYFNCNHRNLDSKLFDIRSSYGKDSATGANIFQRTLIVKYDYVNRQRTKRVHCVCKATARVGRRRIDLETDKERGRIHISTLESDFPVQPQNGDYMVGDDVTIKCTLPNGKPKPWLYWYKEDKQLELRRTDNKYELDNQNLVIKNIQMGDAGDYTCRARNFAGTETSKSGRIQVLEKQKESSDFKLPDEIPTEVTIITDLPPESYLQEDGTVELMCAALPAAHFNINCGRRYLEEDEITVEKEQLPDDAYHSLIRARFTVTEDDMKINPYNFYCKCRFQQFINNKWMTVHSSEGYVKPRKSDTQENYIDDQFESIPEDAEVSIGETVRLDCIPPAGNPQPVVYWIKDGERINPDVDRNFVFMRNGQLALRRVRVEDEGIYICVAENSVGMRQTDPARLDILDKPPPSVPIEPSTTPDDSEDVKPTSQVGSMMASLFKEPPSLTYIGNKGEVNLTCEVIGTNMLLFHCNGKKITETYSNGGYRKDEQTQQIVTGSIMTVTREMVKSQKGEFSCKCAFREEGTEDFKPGSNSYIVKAAYLKDRFIRQPRALSKPEIGSKLVLECFPPVGEPNPEVMWIKDNARVQYSDKIGLENGRNLVIEDFSSEDEGYYTCMARNLVATRQSDSVHVLLDPSVKPTSGPGSDKEMVTKDDTVQVHTPDNTGVITDPTKFHAPYFSKRLYSDYYISIDRPAELTCETVSVHTIGLACNGIDIVEPEIQRRATVNKTMGIDGQLMLKDLWTLTFEVDLKRLQEAEDDLSCACYGLYTDKNGEEKRIEGYLARLHKTYIETPENFEPEERSLNIDTFTQFECKPPTGSPMPQISWLKDGQPAQHTVVPNLGTLVINGVRKSDEGVYECFAENTAGKKKVRTITLRVLDKKIVTDAPMPSTSTEGTGRIGFSPGQVSSTLDEGDQAVPETTPEGSAVIEGNESTTMEEKMKKGEVSPSAGSYVPTDSPTTDAPTVKVEEGRVTHNPRPPYGPVDEGSEEDGATISSEAEPTATSNLGGEDDTKLSPGGEPSGTDSSKPEPSASSGADEKDTTLTEASEGGVDSTQGGVGPDSEAGTKTSPDSGDGSSASSSESEPEGEKIDPSPVPSRTPGHSGGSSGTGMKNTGKQGVSETVDETGDGSVVGPMPKGKDGEEKDCKKSAIECTRLAPKDVKSCQDIHQFVNCLDNLKANCQDRISQFSLENMEDKITWCDAVEARCKPAMEMCEDKLLDSETGAFSIRNLCGQWDNYMDCTDSAMETECGTNMMLSIFQQDYMMDDIEMESQPYVNRHLIKDWAKTYCQQLEDTLASCTHMEMFSFEDTWERAASLHADNNTYWCRASVKLVDYSTSALDKCESEKSVEDSLAALKQICGPEGVFPDDEPPVGEPEGGFDGSSKGDGDASPEGGGDGSIEGGKDASTEGEEGEQSGAPDAGAAATKQGNDKDSSSAMAASLLLTVALQLALAMFLSRR